jgi:hypothetical protein
MAVLAKNATFVRPQVHLLAVVAELGARVVLVVIVPAKSVNSHTYFPLS